MKNKNNPRPPKTTPHYGKTACRFGGDLGPKQPPARSGQIICLVQSKSEVHKPSKQHLGQKRPVNRQDFLPNLFGCVLSMQENKRKPVYC
jgi:hypothetical protein